MGERSTATQVLLLLAMGSAILSPTALLKAAQDHSEAVSADPVAASISAAAGGTWREAGEQGTVIYFHISGTTSDLRYTVQRRILLKALAHWADVTRIDFVEVSVAGLPRSIDLDFLHGDYSDIYPQVSGCERCAFDGRGGELAHSFRPDEPEPIAGDVHFDEDETWEWGDARGLDAYDLEFVATHELGHALGLGHSSGEGDVMGPIIPRRSVYPGLSPADIEAVHALYGGGRGSVSPLESAVEGDANGDGLVGWEDLQALRECYGSQPDTGDLGCSWADLDRNGEVELADFQRFAAILSGS